MFRCIHFSIPCIHASTPLASLARPRSPLLWQTVFPSQDMREQCISEQMIWSSRSLHPVCRKIRSGVLISVLLEPSASCASRAGPTRRGPKRRAGGRQKGGGDGIEADVVDAPSVEHVDGEGLIQIKLDKLSHGHSVGLSEQVRTLSRPRSRCGVSTFRRRCIGPTGSVDLARSR